MTCIRPISSVLNGRFSYCSPYTKSCTKRIILSGQSHPNTQTRPTFRHRPVLPRIVYHSSHLCDRRPLPLHKSSTTSTAQFAGRFSSICIAYDHNYWISLSKTPGRFSRNIAKSTSAISRSYDITDINFIQFRIVKEF